MDIIIIYILSILICHLWFAHFSVCYLVKMLTKKLKRQWKLMSISVHLYFEEKEDGDHKGEMGTRGLPLYLSCFTYFKLYWNKYGKVIEYYRGEEWVHSSLHDSTFLFQIFYTLKKISNVDYLKLGSDAVRGQFNLHHYQHLLQNTIHLCLSQ